jgi:hypothetical protein
MRQALLPTILIGLLASYAAGYLASVQRHYVPDRAEARYRRCDRVGQAVFAPAHWLDRRLRPVYWGPAACVW